MKCNSINENKKTTKSCFKKKNLTGDVHPTPVTRNYNTNEISQVSVKEIKVITF